MKKKIDYFKKGDAIMSQIERPHLCIYISVSCSHALCALIGQNGGAYSLSKPFTVFKKQTEQNKSLYWTNSGKSLPVLFRLKNVLLQNLRKEYIPGLASYPLLDWSLSVVTYEVVGKVCLLYRGCKYYQLANQRDVIATTKICITKPRQITACNFQ